MSTDNPIKVLIVDDNTQYREAFKRTLLIENYKVCEAENSDEAINVMQSELPDVVVTDLQMRTQREGLELIEKIKAADPLIPVIMISAVGSFEEGALATKLGASYVIHKSRIEEEMENFFATIRQSYQELQKNKKLLAIIESGRQIEDSKDNSQQIEQIRNILGDPNIIPYVKGEAYDLITSINARELLRESERNMKLVSESNQQEAIYGDTVKALQENIPAFDSLKKESQEGLTTAEYLYQQQEQLRTLDFSRNIGFSYCFAVENEAKAKLKRKFNRFFSNVETYRTIQQFIDRKSNLIDIFFHQYLLLIQRDKRMDFTIDNVRQTFFRILEHRDRYKPDGLKAIGIIVLCFGREYSFKRRGEIVEIRNPLKIKGLDGDEEVMELAELLISLQHFRNPYIHPEINEMEKLSILRETAFKCLNSVNKLV